MIGQADQAADTQFDRVVEELSADRSVGASLENEEWLLGRYEGQPPPRLWWCLGGRHTLEVPVACHT